MSTSVPLSVLTCCALTVASLFQATSADVIFEPIPTTADRKLVGTYETTDGALSVIDLVCLSGVVMLAATFFERTGRVPTAADRASSANVLQELRIQDTAAGAALFVKQTLAHWVEQISWRYPHRVDNFQQQLVVEIGFDAQKARKITSKLKELDWAKGTFQMAATELARVKQLYGAATSFFQAVVTKAPGCAFTETFPQLASGLEDARDSYEFVPGGVNRWKQFSIRRRSIEWQQLYEQSPQNFYEMLMNSSLCQSEFETSIWLRELDKLQNKLQEPFYDAHKSDFKLDAQGSLLQLDPRCHPDLLSDFKPDPQEVKLQKNPHGQPDLLSDFEPDPQAVKLQTDPHGQPDLLSDFQFDPQDLKVT